MISAPTKIAKPTRVSVERRTASPRATVMTEPVIAPAPYAATSRPYAPAPSCRIWRANGSASWIIDTPSSDENNAPSTATMSTARLRARSASPARKCETTLPATLTVPIGRGAIIRSAPITSRNDNALARNAAPGPNCARTSPARAGPNARAPVNCMPLRRTALISASGGTSWGTKACHAAMVMPAPTAPIVTQPTIRDGVATPLTQMPHSASALAISTTCEHRRTVRRE